ncbi:Cupin 2 conserved barrel domain protein [Desulfonatronospira thiodismutans ASO3-1]|uniref:Cupin 2 conserved barrel domain protein n=1 Tax=Desulfonatronospira thiodismutans ASO3-1 TaxID=555779 RepID=D6SLM8_9BACT|nr:MULTISPECIES: cupin domain-containing protein [Desulfonatronospira]EFI35589.1 Cupin 2 conserved barrel domain protein [Desulfonatronospira thiodismutans ASO3-1]RQD74190.1 MAG: cupin domain-containing protein [Desulfonatronospira sp. MSAO_Bac3]
MKVVNIFEEGTFSDKAMKKNLVHDSPYFRIINFNFRAGQELPIHSHELEGELSIQVLEGEGEYLAKDRTLPARAGDILVCAIEESHGIRAVTDMRVLVTIAPPI